MREIRLAHMDKTRPVLVLTREVARPFMSKVTVAPITTTIKGLKSEVLVGVTNGLHQQCAVSIDNVMTISATKLGRLVGHLSYAQESDLARAVVEGYDLDAPLFSR